LGVHVSVVQSTLSLHSASLQQMAQPLEVLPGTPAQHLVPLAQASKWQLPSRHCGLLWHAAGWHWVGLVQLGALMQPCSLSQT
jgi:hypothetical protein